MNRFAICMFLTATLLLAVNGAHAADKKWDDFWRQFKTAIQRNDKEAVANLTKLPYMLDSKSLNRKDFIKNYDSLFTPTVRKGLLREKPVADKDAYMVFVGEEIFVFSKVKNTYAFSEIGAND